MVLGFKKQFVPKWESGQKKHTIREDKHNRWKAGRVAQFATGVRTKSYHQFDERTCTGTQQIVIEWDVHAIGAALVCVDEKQLSLQEINDLATNDGFDSLYDFYSWFCYDFIGKIIHFTELRY